MYCPVQDDLKKESKGQELQNNLIVYEDGLVPVDSGVMVDDKKEVEDNNAIFDALMVGGAESIPCHGQ